MSKRNVQHNSDGDVAAPVMQASAAVVDEMEERAVSFAQGVNDDDQDEPPEGDGSSDQPSTDDNIKQHFRQNCIEYPDTIHNFELTQVIADPKRNVRFVERTIKDQAVRDLADAIKAAGRQLVPGEVCLGLDDKLYVVDGAGRYLALTLINSTRQPSDQLPFRAIVTIETTGAPAQSLIDQAQINWHREGLTPLDKAKAVGELKATGLKQADIARRLGLKPAVVSSLARIAGFSDQVKQWVVEGKISATDVYDLSVVDPEKVEAQAKKLIDGAGGKKVSSAVVGAVVQKARAEKAKSDKATTKAGKPKARTKQRTAKQILMFVEDEATDATNKKFGDKNLSKKLECVKALVNGVAGDTFLKNLSLL